MVLLFTTLSLPLVAYSSSLVPSISSLGVVTYPPIPPPQPPVDGNYSDLWENDYRVDSKFLDYLSGSTFDFSGFFSQLYNRFLKELETTTFGTGYTRPTLDYGSATYTAGSAVGNLESVADYMCTTEAEIRNALTLAVSGDIIFVKAGTYDISPILFSSKSNLIIAGEGWNTVLRLKDGENSYALRGMDSNNIIVRDLTIDGNRANNPMVSTDLFEFRGASSNILIENVQILHARRIGIDLYDGTRLYTINSVSKDNGWNNHQYTRSSWAVTIGNYFEDARDVSTSTWASNNLVIANNLAVYGIHDGLGYNDANWGIGVEPQGGGSPIDTYNVIIRNNIASDHNQADSTEPWKGTGIWITGSGDPVGTPGTFGSYNIIIDGNTVENNNMRGIFVENDAKYPDGSNIVVVNNNASGNDVYNIGPPNYGDYVILRSGVIQSNNT